jgi:tetratricopeptide (TPR) repeat protein
MLTVLLALVIAGQSATALALDREEILNQGLRSNLPYAASLMNKADEAGGEDRMAYLEEAVQMAPNTPAVYFKLAWAHLPNVFASIGSMTAGFKAYWRNFWWSLSLAGLVYMSLLVSLSIALFVLAAMRLPGELPLLVHDINEKKAKVLIPPIMFVGTAFLGLPLFLAGALFVVGIYAKRSNRAPFYIAALLVVTAPVTLGLASFFLSASAPATQAVVAVNEGRENAYAVEVLRGRKDFSSLFSYATALKRQGHVRDAVLGFRDLLEINPDPRVYTNLGNAYVYAKQANIAKTAYAKALERGKSATTLYNLSQVYRDELNFAEGDKYYEEAFLVSSAKVSRYTAIAGKHPNRLVIDETLTIGELWDYARTSPQVRMNIFALDPLVSAGVGLGLLVFFVIVTRTFRSVSFRCTKCNSVACTLCSDPKQLNQMCAACQSAQSVDEDTSARARVARMLAAGNEKGRMVNFVRVLSFLPPGVAQIYSGRMFSGLFFLWAFCFGITVLVLNPLFKTGLMGYSHSWLWLFMVPFLMAVYYVSFIVVNRRLDRGWL